MCKKFIRIYNMEPRRTELVPISIPDKEKKKVKKIPKTFRIVLTIGESNATTCPEFSFADLLKTKKKSSSSKGESFSADPFDEQDDSEVLAIAQQFEKKYGPKAFKSGKKKRTRDMDDFYDLGDGYDEDDPFIDNTDAYDEVVPSTLTTMHGGFYINQGKLDFKSTYDDSFSGDTFDSPKISKNKKRVIESDSSDNEQKKKKDDEPLMGEALAKKLNAMRKKKKKELRDEELKKKRKLNEDKAIEKGVIKIKKKKLSFVKIKNKEKDSTGIEGVSIKTNDSGLTKSTAPTTSPTSTPSTTTTSATSVVTVSNGIDAGTDAVKQKKPEESVLPSATPTMTEAGKLGGGGSSEELSSKSSSEEKSALLPPNLPTDLLNKIDTIKKEARECKDEKKSKFFSQPVNNLLLEIEISTRNLAWGNRTAVYNHLGEHLPCGNQALLRRAKKLMEMRQDSELKEPLKKLREAIVKAMPAQIEKREAELKLRQELTEDISEDMKEDPSASTESDEEDKDKERKKSRIAKRVFEWTSELRELLIEVVTEKMKLINVFKSRNQSPLEYLKAYLESDIKPLWPTYWMNTRILIKETKGILENQLKFKKKPQPGLSTPSPSVTAATSSSKVDVTSTPSSSKTGPPATFTSRVSSSTPSSHVSSTVDVIEISSVLENNINTVSVNLSDSQPTSQNSRPLINTKPCKTATNIQTLPSSQQVAKSSDSVKRITPVSVDKIDSTKIKIDTTKIKIDSNKINPISAKSLSSSLHGKPLPSSTSSSFQSSASVASSHSNKMSSSKSGTPTSGQTTALSNKAMMLEYEKYLVRQGISPASVIQHQKLISPHQKQSQETPKLHQNVNHSQKAHPTSHSPKTPLPPTKQNMPANKMAASTKSKPADAISTLKQLNDIKKEFPNTFWNKSDSISMQNVSSHKTHETQSQSSKLKSNKVSLLDWSNQHSTSQNTNSKQSEIWNPALGSQSTPPQTQKHSQDHHIHAGSNVKSSNQIQAQRSSSQSHPKIKYGSSVTLSPSQLLSVELPKTQNQPKVVARVSQGQARRISPNTPTQRVSPPNRISPTSQAVQAMLHGNTAPARNSVPSPSSPNSPGSSALSVYEQIQLQIKNQEAVENLAKKNLFIASQIGGHGKKTASVGNAAPAYTPTPIHLLSKQKQEVQTKPKSGTKPSNSCNSLPKTLTVDLFGEDSDDDPSGNRKGNFDKNIHPTKHKPINDSKKQERLTCKSDQIVQPDVRNKVVTSTSKTKPTSECGKNQPEKSTKDLKPKTSELSRQQSESYTVESNKLVKQVPAYIPTPIYTPTSRSLLAKSDAPTPNNPVQNISSAQKVRTPHNPEVYKGQSAHDLTGKSSQRTPTGSYSLLKGGNLDTELNFTMLFPSVVVTLSLLTFSITPLSDF